MTDNKWYLKEKCFNAWRVVLQYAQKSAVFIDSKSGECLHWNGGIQQLYNVEPVIVCDLNSSQIPALPNIREAVFICTALAHSVRLDLSNVILKNSFTSCTLITSLVDSSTQELKNEITGWMSTNAPSSEILNVEIIHFPLFISPVLDNVFLTPVLNSLPVILSDKIPHDELLLKKNMQFLATSLHSLLLELHCSDTIFSIGNVSREVADFLQSHPSTAERRKGSAQTISVVLVDRGLDLAGPSSYDSDCVLDRLLSTLPHLPNHSSDVAVDMSPICHAQLEDVFDEALAPGCLAHSDPVGKTLLELLIHKKQRAVISELDKLLADDQEATGKNVARTIKPQTLEKHVTQFKRNYEVIMDKSSVLQVSLGVVQSLIGKQSEAVDQAINYEKLLLGNLYSEQDHDSVMEHVSKLIINRSDYGLSVDILLSILVSLYALLGPNARFSNEVEKEMIRNLSRALYEDQSTPGIAHSVLFSLEADSDAIKANVHKFISLLNIVAQTRKRINKYSSLTKSQESGQNSVYNSFLVQLLVDILNRSAGLPYLTSPSDGRFMSLLFGSNKPLSKGAHPADNSDLLLFIVGGVTGSEIHQLQETWSRIRPSGRLLIGSTSLLSPSDVLSSLLQSIPQD